MTAPAADAVLAGWLRQHRAELTAALWDAVGYREPEGADCFDCTALNEGIPAKADGSLAVLCPDHSDDDATASRWEALIKALEALP